MALDSPCLTLTADRQEWAGIYLGNGKYAIRYAPKQAGLLHYTITSDVPGFHAQSGELIVDNRWPGHPRSTDFKLGPNWYTDRSDAKLYDGKWQGAETVLKRRDQALLDWQNAGGG